MQGGCAVKTSISAGGDVKIGQLPQHHGTIVAAIAKYPHKRANALSTVLCDEHGLYVKWKALETYCLRHQLWTYSRPKPCVQPPIVTPASGAATASSSIIDAKIGDLPAYRDQILLAIRNNPGSKGMALSAIMEKTYGVRIHHAALKNTSSGIFDLMLLRPLRHSYPLRNHFHCPPRES